MSQHDDDFEFANDNPPPSRPGVVNEGRHTVRVSSIGRGTPPWSDEVQVNLMLRADECNNRAAIIVNVPVSNARRLEAMAAALGGDVATLVEGELGRFANREIEVIVGHFTRRDGTVGAGVKAFLPRKAKPVAYPVAAKPVIAAKSKPLPPLEITDELIEAVAQRVIVLLETKGVPTHKSKAAAALAKKAPSRKGMPRAAEKAQALMGDDDDLPF